MIKPSDVMDTGIFLVMVAQDRVMEKYGTGIFQIPMHHLWLIISAEKCLIVKEELLDLMRSYNVGTLKDFQRYYGDLPRRSNNEKAN